MNGNGVDDVFVATQGQTSISNGQTQQYPAELVFFDGKTGSLIRSLDLGQEPITNAMYVDGRVITSDSNGVLTCYDSTLNQIWNITLADNPQVIRVRDSSNIVLAVDDNVSDLKVDDGSTVWTWSGPAKIEDLLTTSSWTVCYYAGNLTLLDANGNFVDDYAVPRPVLSYAVYSETLHQLDNTSFLMLEDAWSIFESSPNPTLTKFQVSGNLSAPALNEIWQIEVGGGSANKPFIVGDVEGDGFNDFICAENESETLGLFSGKTGIMIYSIGVSAMYLNAGSMMNDMGTGSIEVALAPYTGGYTDGLYLCSLQKTNSTLTAIDPLNFYCSVSTIQNVPGENYSEIIAATEDGQIRCFSVYTQTIPEFPVPTFLATLCLISLFAIIIKRIFAKDRRLIEARHGRTLQRRRK
jgi:hypothetical protein